MDHNIRDVGQLIQYENIPEESDRELQMRLEIIVQSCSYFVPSPLPKSLRGRSSDDKVETVGSARERLFKAHFLVVLWKATVMRGGFPMVPWIDTKEQVQTLVVHYV